MGTVDTTFLGGEFCSYRVHLKNSVAWSKPEIVLIYLTQ